MFLTQSLPVIAASALLALALFCLLERLRPGPAARPLREQGQAFVLRGGTVVDAHPATTLRLMPGEGDLDALARVLGPRWPDIRAHLGTPDRALHQLAADGSAWIDLTPQPLGLRIDITPTEPRDPDAEERKALLAELDGLRGIADALPYPVWRETGGVIEWVNRAYLGHCAASSWPPQRLFPVMTSDDSDFAGRQWLEVAGDQLPFEVAGHAHSGGLLCSAIPAQAAVRTENSLRDFVQTLSKTFAQVQVGMAVFSRDRRLVLFNPALSDLTHLRADFLASRPSLFEFLDSLRDRRQMPEPRDYKAWREGLADAAAGRRPLVQTWHLPHGRTHRVTGLPQPEGALSILIEDVTAETAMGRNYHEMIGLNAAILDHVADAVAVFAANGQLVLTNEAYDRLWDFDSAGPDPSSLDSVVPDWRAAALPGAVLPDANQNVANLVGQTGVLPLTDGRRLAWAFAALPNGAVMATFRTASGAAGDAEHDDGRPRLRLLA